MGRPYPDLRVLAGLYYNPNQMMTRQDSGINSLADFKGKRFSPGAVGGTSDGEAKIHFTAAGLKYPGDLRLERMDVSESIELMRNKQLDGIWVMAGIPTAAVMEMYATANAKLLSLDDTVVNKVIARYPWYAKFTIPAGVYDGQDAPVTTTAVKMLLLTDSSLPDDLVYELTKTFWENLDEMSKAHSVMKTVTPDMAVKDLSDLPLHTGAEKYYREAGLIR